MSRKKKNDLHNYYFDESGAVNASVNIKVKFLLKFTWNNNKPVIYIKRTQFLKRKKKPKKLQKSLNHRIEIQRNDIQLGSKSKLWSTRIQHFFFFFNTKTVCNKSASSFL